MSSSREQSPDWLRSFQPPTHSAIELSSGSESPLEDDPVSDDEDGIKLSKLFKKEATVVQEIKENDDAGQSTGKKPVKGKSPQTNEKVKRTPDRKRKSEKDNEKEGKKAKGRDARKKNTLEKNVKSNEQNHSIWSLSSDSESSPDTSPIEKDKVEKKKLSAKSKDLVTENIKDMDDTLVDHDGKSLKNKVSEVKLPLESLDKEDEKISRKGSTNCSLNGENEINNGAVKEETRKHPGPQVSSSSLPLLLSEKVQRTKALVECEGDSIDLSGDVGSVGRVVISDDPSKNQEMFLDLKGTIYKTTIIPSRTFCVVSFGPSEAKIEAIMNDYIQLKSVSNVYEAETMVEGTLDGFSFDSEDEADRSTAQADQPEATEEQPDGKTKRKAEKISGAAKKKGRPAGGKPPKNQKKKPQAPKKGKTKK